MPVGMLAICALVWLVRFIVSARSGGPGMRWYAVAPLGGVLSLVLVLTHVPLNARFSIAEDELVAIAEARLAATAPGDPRVPVVTNVGSVGTYDVERVEVHDGLVYFTLGSCGWFASDCGVIYAPAGATPPTDNSIQDVEHFRGPWYRWWSLIDVMD